MRWIVCPNCHSLTPDTGEPYEAVICAKCDIVIPWRERIRQRVTDD